MDEQHTHPKEVHLDLEVKLRFWEERLSQQKGRTYRYFAMTSLCIILTLGAGVVATSAFMRDDNFIHPPSATALAVVSVLGLLYFGSLLRTHMRALDYVSQFTRTLATLLRLHERGAITMEQLQRTLTGTPEPSTEKDLIA